MVFSQGDLDVLVVHLELEMVSALLVVHTLLLFVASAVGSMVVVVAFLTEALELVVLGE